MFKPEPSEPQPDAEEAFMEEAKSLIQEAPVASNSPTRDQPADRETKEPPPPVEARRILTRLAVLLDEWIQNCEEKVNLTSAAYDSTDRHVRILDAAFAEQERILSPVGEAPDAEEEENIVVTLADRSSKQRHARKHTKTPSSSTSNKKQKKAAPPQAEPPPSTTSRGSHRKRIDMEILPSEPRYCYCNQVSYGDMVGCDNQHCAREWFHLHCVGLVKNPDVNKSWYCPDCSTALQVGRKTRRKR